MGYAQTTTGVTTTGPGATLSFATPICAQMSVQVAFSGSVSLTVEFSLDGVNFITANLTWSSTSSSNGQIRSSAGQVWTPFAAIRYNVTAISGSADISIAAAPSGSE